ncbi:hypothetical protein EJ07DRAFT_158507 [Lizonia empirigonia]|nr:hypothetical protein EJ07DRAFT_158507 [Lizonia empirigonia]
METGHTSAQLTDAQVKDSGLPQRNLLYPDSPLSRCSLTHSTFANRNTPHRRLMALTNIALDYVRTWTGLTLLGLDDMDSEQACSAYRATWINGVHLVAAVIAAAMSDNMYQEKHMHTLAVTIPSSMRPKDSLISASLTLEGLRVFLRDDVKATLPRVVLASISRIPTLTAISLADVGIAGVLFWLSRYMMSHNARSYEVKITLVMLERSSFIELNRADLFCSESKGIRRRLDPSIYVYYTALRRPLSKGQSNYAHLSSTLEVDDVPAPLRIRGSDGPKQTTN